MEEDGHVISTIRQWDRRHWGKGGLEFHWWCTEDPEAFVGKIPVYQEMQAELTEMVGATVVRAIPGVHQAEGAPAGGARAFAAPRRSASGTAPTAQERGTGPAPDEVRPGPVAQDRLRLRQLRDRESRSKAIWHHKRRISLSGSSATKQHVDPGERDVSAAEQPTYLPE